jgi:hypothetical protein
MLRHQLGKMAVELVMPLRNILQLHEPSRTATACIVLSQMMHLSPAFCKALVPQFWQLGNGLGSFFGLRQMVNLGYNSRKVCSLHEIVELVLEQFHYHAGKPALLVIKRYVPLFCPPVQPRRVAPGAAHMRGTQLVLL